jgi:hypothetical protein
LEQSPRDPVTHSKLLRERKGGMPSLITRNKKNSPKPHKQWSSGSVKNRASGQRCLVITSLAFKKLSTLYHEILISLAPRTAISIGPSYLEKIFLAVLFISKLFMKIEKRQWALLCHDDIL